MSKKPCVFSFFAGAGFLDLGFELSGFNIVYVNDIIITGSNPKLLCHEKSIIENKFEMIDF